MHRAFLLLALVAGLAVAAAYAPAVSAQADPEKRAARKQKMLEEFDADGDGKLNKEERQAARAAKGPRKGRPGPPPGPLGDMLTNPEQTFRSHDTNGDGSLNLPEFQAMVEKIRAAGPPPRGPRGHRGPHGPRGENRRRGGRPPADELE